MTSSLIEVEQIYFFSSSELLGAKQRSSVGHSFEVLLDKEITIPPSAIDCTIECRAANIWFTSPNIAAEYNNNILYLTYNGVDFSITIPDGLYSVPELNNIVQREISALFVPISIGVYETFRFSSNSISFSSIVSRQRILLKMTAGMHMRTDLNLVDNIAYTLGFSSTIGSPPLISTYIGHYFEAVDVARLNHINSYLIHTDLVNEGISINNNRSNILTEIQLIDVSIGQQLKYRPYLPYKVSGSHLKYGSKSLIHFYLTDELNRPIDTFGENYSFSIAIIYKIENHTIGLHGFTQNAQR